METDLKIDLLIQLPKEISLKVLSYLSARELSTACNVSKSWREIANCNLLWRRLCRRESLCDLAELIIPITNGCADQNLEPACTWAQLYHGKQRLLANWTNDNYTWMSIDQEKPSVDVFNNILAVAYWVVEVPNVDVLVIKPNCLERLQTLSVPFRLAHDPIGVTINGQVLEIELTNISVLYRNENEKYVYETVLCAHEQCVCSPGEEQQFVKSYHGSVRCWTLCLAGRYIWYQASSVVIIYDRKMRTFRTMDDIQQVVAVDMHGEHITVQCPHSVKVFRVDGQLLYTYMEKPGCFYTGFVMSPTSFAFLQSEDFCDPHVVQVELGSWQISRETSLKVYRVTLHMNTIFLLSQDPFTITSMSQGITKWSNFIRGTRYLRPGKDFFEVICSKFVFVCPSLARLDMFSLYDINTGNHMYHTSLDTSSYNIKTISNSCLVVHSKKCAINIRSYV